MHGHPCVATRISWIILASSSSFRSLPVSPQNHHVVLVQAVTPCFLNYVQTAPCLAKFSGIHHSDSPGISQLHCCPVLKKRKNNYFFKLTNIFIMKFKHPHHLFILPDCILWHLHLLDTIFKGEYHERKIIYISIRTTDNTGLEQNILSCRPQLGQPLGLVVGLWGSHMTFWSSFF